MGVKIGPTFKKVTERFRSCYSEREDVSDRWLEKTGGRGAGGGVYLDARRGYFGERRGCVP